jgi:isocitrate dehydrogenase kinase/phosphatase
MTSAYDNLSELAAKAIRQAFDSYQGQYAAITQRAKARFENRDWPGIQADAGERLDLYKKWWMKLLLRSNDCLAEESMTLSYG